MTPTPRAWLRLTPADIEELGTLLCSVADNLGDMPVSDDWAAKTSRQAFELLARNKYFRPADVAQERATIDSAVAAECERCAAICDLVWATTSGPAAKRCADEIRNGAP